MYWHTFSMHLLDMILKLLMIYKMLYQFIFVLAHRNEDVLIMPLQHIRQASIS